MRGFVYMLKLPVFLAGGLLDIMHSNLTWLGR